MSPTPSAQFDYVRGNPDNLVGAADADMGDIQGPFYDIKDWLNSQILDLIAQGGLLIGEVRFIAVAARPTMWLACDGQSKDRALYPQLFSAIATTYGPGTVPGSTFNLPDLRGRGLIGPGASDAHPTGNSTRVAGQKYGEEFHQLTPAESGVNNNGLAQPMVDGSLVGTGSNFSGAAGLVTGGTFFQRAFGNDTPIRLVARNADVGHNNQGPVTCVPAWIFAGVEP